MSDYGLIGGTDVPKILGIAPYGGPIDAYRRIRERYSPPLNDAMRRGMRLEPVARALYVDETGAELLPNPGYLKSKRYEFMGASLDDMATRDGERLVVEYKTAGLRAMRQWGEEGSDDVPDHYRVQVAWYLCATGLPHGDLAALIAGDDFRVYRITRDLELESMLIEAAERFWRNHIVPGVPPPPDASEGYGTWLQERYPHSNGELIASTPAIDAVAARLRDARAAREAAEEAEQAARNELLAFIGAADGVQGQGWKATYRTTKGRASTDWKAVCAEARVDQALIEKHTSRNPFRMFRPTFEEKP